MVQFITKRKDFHWINLYAFFVLLLTSIPYWFGFMSLEYQDSNADWVFSGFLFGVDDGQSYIAKMSRGEAGDILFRSSYSAMHQTGVLVNLPYILLGKLAGGDDSHTQLVALFHMFRVISGYVCILATYDLLSEFVTDTYLKIIGVILSTVGGGLGWLLVLLGKQTLFGSIPLDFYSPESFGFLSIYGIPHLALARAFFLWGILFSYRSLISPDKSTSLRKGLAVGLIWLVIFLLQPITGILFGIVLGFMTISGLLNEWKGKKGGDFSLDHLINTIKVQLIALILICPYLCYLIYKFSKDPYLIGWSAQNQITSPHALHYFFAYHIFFLAALIGAIILVRNLGMQSSFWGLWLLFFPILVYIPLNIQRRLAEGIWIVLVLLTLIAIQDLFQHSPALKKNLAYILLCISLPSSLILIIGGWSVAINRQSPTHLAPGLISAYAFLADFPGSKNSIVAADYQISNALPAWAPVFVLLGHGPESIKTQGLEEELSQFLSRRMSLDQIKKFVNLHKIRFIILGPDQPIELKSDLNQSLGIYEIYQFGEYGLYQVSPNVVP